VLTRLGEKKEDKDGAAARFARIEVATAMNQTTANSRNVAHLGEISSSQEVEKMEELEADLEVLGGEVRQETKARGAREALGGNGDGAFAVRVTREREGESGRALASTGCRGVHDGVDDLMSGANTGVRSPNGSQVLRWSATTARTTSIQNPRRLSDRATLTMINSQTVAN